MSNMGWDGEMRLDSAEQYFYGFGDRRMLGELLRLIIINEIGKMEY